MFDVDQFPAAPKENVLAEFNSLGSTEAVSSVYVEERMIYKE